MAKKNLFNDSKRKEFDEIVGWKPPQFHQASECYVSFIAFDPSVGQFRKKRIMLDHIKGKRAQKQYGMVLVRKLTEKLIQGWNPWIEAVQPLEYTNFDDACERYKEYLLKMSSEHDMREETIKSYLSRLKIFREWKEKKNINLFYTYQFDRKIVGQFIDYIFVDRNNTMRTRNNYLCWVKTFCKYMLQRGYISIDPTTGINVVKKKHEAKNRDVIPDSILKELQDWLTKHNKHFLLACYILHYCLVRPHEMSYLRIGDFSVKNHTLHLHGDNTKNHSNAVITVPHKVLKLMIELKVFNSPSNYYLFSNGFAPGKERRDEKHFRDYWHHYIRKNLKLPLRYKFYSLKDTGITNMLRANTDILTVRDQARHSSILITDIYTPKDIKAANEMLLNYHGVL